MHIINNTNRYQQQCCGTGLTLNVFMTMVNNIFCLVDYGIYTRCMIDVGYI